MIPKLVEQSGITCTINTTEDCNLRCKYCYEINKKKKYLKTDDAYRFIDLLLDNDDIVGLREGDPEDDLFKNFQNRGIILDFIGGDALMDVQQLDKIMTYFVTQLNTKKTKNALIWRHHYRFTIATNGTLFEEKGVKEFLEKWKKVISLGISIDGCKEIHDAYRVYPDMVTGSMDTILKSWDWYKKTFPYDANRTKATCSKASIPYLLKSLKFMHEDLGMEQVIMNFVMEDSHFDVSDYIEYDKQMRECVKYVLEHRHDLYWDLLGTQYANHKRSEGDEWEYKGHCGSGAMPCLGIDGNIYPCFRWLPHTQSSYKSPIIVGNLEKGFYNKDGFVQVRHGACRKNCSMEKCRTCEYESACPYCIAGCYSEFGDFKRTTYICEIIKITCKWAKVYWNEYRKLENKPLEYSEEFTLNNVKEYEYEV